MRDFLFSEKEKKVAYFATEKFNTLNTNYDP